MWGGCGWLELPKVLCLPARQPGSPLHRAGLVCDLRVCTELQSGQMAVCRRAQPGPPAPALSSVSARAGGNLRRPQETAELPDSALGASRKAFLPG